MNPQLMFAFAMLALLVGLLLLFTDLLGVARRRKLHPDELEMGELPSRPTWIENIRIDLAEAGIENVSVNQFLMYSVILGVVTTLLLAVVAGMWIIGVVAGLTVSVLGLRYFYVNRLATRRHRTINQQVADACRAISANISSGTEQQKALEVYARRSDQRSLGRALTGERDEVAVTLATGIRLADMQAISRAGALTRAANDLGNQYLITMIETFNQNAPISAEQTAEALIKFAREVEYEIKLLDERITAVTQPLTSYIIVGAIAFGMAFLVSAMISAETNFFTTATGQLLLIAMVAWWLTGYWLQRRKLSGRG